MIWKFVGPHWGIHSQYFIILQCFRALIRLNVFLVPLTSIYSLFINILFHCCDIMSTTSSFIPVLNNPVVFFFFFPHLVLVFSTMKWFWSLCVHPSSNIVSIPNQCFSDVTCFKCFLHSLHIKYIQSFKNMQCFSCVTCFKCFSNPLELKHTQEFMTIQCFSAVTCFKCFFFYSMVNTSSSLSPLVVSVLLHSASLSFHIL